MVERPFIFKDRYLALSPLLSDHYRVYHAMKSNEPLMQAVEHGHVGAVKEMCQTPQPYAAVTQPVSPLVLNTALLLAAQRGHVSVVQYLCRLPVDWGVKPSSWLNVPLRVAAKNGHVQVIKWLCQLPLDRDVCPSACDNYAVREAAENGHVDVVHILCELPCERGVDPASHDNDAVGTAAECGDIATVQLLLSLPRARGVDKHVALQRAFTSPTPRAADVVRYLCYHLPPSRRFCEADLTEACTWDKASPVCVAVAKEAVVWHRRAPLLRLWTLRRLLRGSITHC